jgi:hypothetical protein
MGVCKKRVNRVIPNHSIHHYPNLMKLTALYLLLATLNCTLCTPLLAETAATEKDKPASIHTPKPGSPERKAILDVLRLDVAKAFPEEHADAKAEPVVFTLSHFKVQGDWAFVDATMEPAYGEQGGVIAALRLIEGKWVVKFASYADDVTNYDQLSKKLSAPRSIFPSQGK